MALKHRKETGELLFLTEGRTEISWYPESYCTGVRTCFQSPPSPPTEQKAMRSFVYFSALNRAGALSCRSALRQRGRL